MNLAISSTCGVGLGLISLKHLTGSFCRWIGRIEPKLGTGLDRGTRTGLKDSDLPLEM